MRSLKVYDFGTVLKRSPQILLQHVLRAKVYSNHVIFVATAPCRLITYAQSNRCTSLATAGTASTCRWQLIVYC